MKRRHTGLSYNDFEYIVFFIVFVVVLLISLVTGFWSNCIWRWPIQWDVGACFKEQIKPAENKAASAASNFIPEEKAYRKHW